MADLVLGAALGTSFAVLYDTINEVTVCKFKMLKPLLGALKTTVASIQPLVIKQIGVYNVKLELPNDQLEKLQTQMREGEELICKLSRLRWWNRIKSRYIVQLVDLDSSLKALMQHVVMQQARDIKENLLVGKQTAKQLIEFQQFNERLLQERRSLQEHAKESQDRFLLLLQRNNAEQLVQLQRVIEDTTHMSQMMMLQETMGVTYTETEDLVGVAAAVTLFKVLFGNLEALFKQNVTFKPVLRNIKSTLDSLGPVIDVMKDSDQHLSYGQKRQIHRLATNMRDGVELFQRCLKVGTWNIHKSLSNSNKLIQWNESLQRERDTLIAIVDDQRSEKPCSAPSHFG